MILTLPSRWVFNPEFEGLLNQANPHQSQESNIEIVIPKNCKISIQAALLLVSLINQLSLCGTRIVITFNSIEGAYGYLSRMAFFERLVPAIEVRPKRPLVSGAMIHRGDNPALVEIHELPLGQQDDIRELPGLLASSLRKSLHDQPDAETIEVHIATVLTEVLDNVYQHSHTPLPGFVALQPYKNASPPKVILAISDSGHGITRTLREAEPEGFQRTTEAGLILKVFKEGLSRFGIHTGRGGGLRRCAEISLMYGAELSVRVPTARARLTPVAKEYQQSLAFSQDDVPLLWGTHLCFEFQLTG